MLILSKKYCFILVVLFLLVLLRTALGVLYRVGVIGLEGSNHSGSSGSSGGNSGENFRWNLGCKFKKFLVFSKKIFVLK